MPGRRQRGAGGSRRAGRPHFVGRGVDVDPPTRPPSGGRCLPGGADRRRPPSSWSPASTRTPRSTSLRHQGVAGRVTVSGCLGLMGGSGPNVAGYACTGSYTLGGHQLPPGHTGHSASPRPVTRPGRGRPGDPPLLSTPAAVAAQHALVEGVHRTGDPAPGRRLARCLPSRSVLVARLPADRPSQRVGVQHGGRGAFRRPIGRGRACLSHARRSIRTLGDDRRRRLSRWQRFTGSVSTMMLKPAPADDEKARTRNRS